MPEIQYPTQEFRIVENRRYESAYGYTHTLERSNTYPDEPAGPFARITWLSDDDLKKLYAVVQKVVVEKANADNT